MELSRLKPYQICQQATFLLLIASTEIAEIQAEIPSLNIGTESLTVNLTGPDPIKLWRAVVPYAGDSSKAVVLDRSGKEIFQYSVQLRKFFSSSLLTSSNELFKMIPFNKTKYLVTTYDCISWLDLQQREVRSYMGPCSDRYNDNPPGNIPLYRDYLEPPTGGKALFADLTADSVNGAIYFLASNQGNVHRIKIAPMKVRAITSADTSLRRLVSASDKDGLLVVSESQKIIYIKAASTNRRSTTSILAYAIGSQSDDGYLSFTNPRQGTAKAAMPNVYDAVYFRNNIFLLRESVTSGVVSFTKIRVVDMNIGYMSTICPKERVGDANCDPSIKIATVRNSPRMSILPYSKELIIRGRDVGFLVTIEPANPPDKIVYDGVSVLSWDHSDAYSLELYRVKCVGTCTLMNDGGNRQARSKKVFTTFNRTIDLLDEISLFPIKVYTLELSARTRNGFWTNSARKHVTISEILPPTNLRSGEYSLIRFRVDDRRGTYSRVKLMCIPFCNSTWVTLHCAEPLTRDGGIFDCRFDTVWHSNISQTKYTTVYLRGLSEGGKTVDSNRTQIKPKGLVIINEETISAKIAAFHEVEVRYLYTSAHSKGGSVLFLHHPSYISISIKGTALYQVVAVNKREVVPMKLPSNPLLSTYYKFPSRKHTLVRLKFYNAINETIVDREVLAIWRVKSGLGNITHLPDGSIRTNKTGGTNKDGDGKDAIDGKEGGDGTTVDGDKKGLSSSIIVPLVIVCTMLFIAVVATSAIYVQHKKKKRKDQSKGHHKRRKKLVIHKIKEGGDYGGDYGNYETVVASPGPNSTKPASPAVPAPVGRIAKNPASPAVGAPVGGIAKNPASPAMGAPVGRIAKNPASPVVGAPVGRIAKNPASPAVGAPVGRIAKNPSIPAMW